MLDTQEQLARLRQRIAAIDRRFSAPSRPPPPELVPESPERSFIEDWATGEVVSNEHGEHFESERLFARHKYHGSADVGALAELPYDLLDALSGGEIDGCCPQRWAFLDTETTGLAGGSGTYAFLIGVGRITAEGFYVRHFFMRELAEERSVLHALTDHLQHFDVLVTYNGKSYDQPLLETRYRMTRNKPPFARLKHVDLLHGARRLWKLRLEGCRLMQLEERILGMYREGDLPGEMIPYVYFEYLRSREAHRLAPIFHHNAMDILTLACLTRIVPAAFRARDAGILEGLGIRRGEDLAGIARWLLTAGEPERAVLLFRRAVAVGLPDALLWRTLWDVALAEKKLGRPSAAVQIFSDLASFRNPYRSSALEELAKQYEHTERNYVMALEFTLQAFTAGPRPELLHRKARLERRIAKQRTPPLLDPATPT